MPESQEGRQEHINGKIPGMEIGATFEEDTCLADSWHDMEIGARFRHVLSYTNPIQWFQDSSIAVLAEIWRNPQWRGQAIAIWTRELRQPTRILEEAVGHYLLRRAQAAAENDFPIPQTSTELLAKTFPDLRMFVAEVLAEGFTILAGKPKKGKSYLALDMSLALAVGRQAFRSLETERSKVLYISMEDGERRLQRRLKAIQPNIQSPYGLDFLYDFKRLGEGCLEALANYADDYQVIVIDILGRLLPSAAADRQSFSEYQQMTELLGPIQKLAEDKRIAIVAIDHVRKASAEDAGDTIMGSQGKFGTVDHALIYERKGEEHDAVLRVLSRDLDENKFIMSMVDGHLECLGKGEIYELDSEQNHIINVLKEDKRPMSIVELMKAMGVSESHYARFRKVLYRLYSEDRIGRTKRGLYRLYSSEDNDDVPF